MAPHGLVARHHVLDVTGEEVAVVGEAVGERRAVVEHVLVVGGPLSYGGGKGGVGGPALEDRPLHGRVVGAAGNLGIRGLADVAHGDRAYRSPPTRLVLSSSLVRFAHSVPRSKPKPGRAPDGAPSSLEVRRSRPSRVGGSASSAPHTPRARFARHPNPHRSRRRRVVEGRQFPAPPSERSSSTLSPTTSNFSSSWTSTELPSGSRTSTS